MTKIYLCHPYSDPDPEVMRARFVSANKIAGAIMRLGYVVFSPLSHSVPIAEHLDNHKSYDFWLGQDLPMLEACDEVWVPNVPGTIESRGIGVELLEASRLLKPVVHFRFNDGEIINPVRVHPRDFHWRPDK